MGNIEAETAGSGVLNDDATKVLDGGAEFHVHCVGVPKSHFVGCLETEKV